jgi:hypothetical protein
MERAAPVQHCFRFVGPWAPIGFVGRNAGCVVIGAALLLLGQAMLPVSWPSGRALVACVLYGAGGTVVITGGCFFALGLWIVFVRLIRVPVVRVTADGMRIGHLGWNSVLIPFASVKWVKRELPRNGAEYVLLVHGPDLQTESVGRHEIGPTAYEALLALLAERCPDAFTEDPPAGWRFPD